MTQGKKRVGHEKTGAGSDTAIRYRPTQTRHPWLFLTQPDMRSGTVLIGAIQRVDQTIRDLNMTIYSSI